MTEDKKSPRAGQPETTAAAPATPSPAAPQIGAQDRDVPVRAIDAPDPAATLGNLIPEDLADRLKESGREWQGKAEAALALWLDEASLALRREGLSGLSRTMREKAEDAQRRAKAGEFERDIDRLLSKVAGTIGRDIAASAIGTALSGFAAAARASAPAPTRGSNDTAARDPVKADDPASEPTVDTRRDEP